MKDTFAEASSRIEQSSHTIARETGHIVLEGFALSQIQDEQAQEVIIRLLNVVEGLSADRRAAQQEHQRLREASARLKGDKGQPNINPNAPSKHRHYAAAKDRQGGHGEQEAQASRAQPTGRKQARGRIDRAETLHVDPALLPGDAQCKGDEDVLVHDRLFRTDNGLLHNEKCYSPSAQKTSVTEMPLGYQGQCGPQLQALVWVEYCAAHVSEPKMVEWRGSAGIISAAAEVSHLLSKQPEPRHAEQAESVRAGSASAWRVRRWVGIGPRLRRYRRRLPRRRRRRLRP